MNIELNQNLPLEVSQGSRNREDSFIYIKYITYYIIDVYVDVQCTYYELICAQMYSDVHDVLCVYLRVHSLLCRSLSYFLYNNYLNIFTKLKMYTHFVTCDFLLSFFLIKILQIFTNGSLFSFSKIYLCLVIIRLKYYLIEKFKTDW